MALLQLQYILDISSKHHVVATHDKLVLVDGHAHIVKMAHLNESSALHVAQLRIAQRLTNKLIVRRHYHLHRIFHRILIVRFRRLAVWQQTVQGDDAQHTDKQAEQARYRRGQHVHH